MEATELVKRLRDLLVKHQTVHVTVGESVVIKCLSCGASVFGPRCDPASWNLRPVCNVSCEIQLILGIANDWLEGRRLLSFEDCKCRWRLGDNPDCPLKAHRELGLKK
jgi:hypothetical protein